MYVPYGVKTFVCAGLDCTVQPMSRQLKVTAANVAMIVRILVAGTVMALLRAAESLRFAMDTREINVFGVGFVYTHRIVEIIHGIASSKAAQRHGGNK